MTIDENNAKNWLARLPSYRVVVFRGIPVDKFSKPELIRIIGFMMERMCQVEESSHAPSRPSYWSH